MHALEHQAHKGFHFFLGALPVLFREGEERQVRNAEFHTRFGYGANAFNALEMAVDTLFSAFFRPAAVSVHYD